MNRDKLIEISITEQHRRTISKALDHDNRPSTMSASEYAMTKATVVRALEKLSKNDILSLNEWSIITTELSRYYMDSNDDDALNTYSHIASHC